MIYFNFTFSRPAWANRFKNIKTWAGKTFIEHKFWEVEILKLDNLFRVEFSYTIKQDHAGLMLELGLFGYELHLTLYDHRHWDYDRDCWTNEEKYE